MSTTGPSSPDKPENNVNRVRNTGQGSAMTNREHDGSPMIDGGQPQRIRTGNNSTGATEVCY